MLLLDEPLNAVDAQTRKVVRQALRSLSESGKTIVVATHDTQEIEVEFDRVVHLHGGLCDGEPQRLAEAVQQAVEQRASLEEI